MTKNLFLSRLVEYIASVLNCVQFPMAPPQQENEIGISVPVSVIKEFVPREKSGAFVLQPIRTYQSLFIMYPQAAKSILYDSQTNNPYIFFYSPDGLTAITGYTLIAQHWITSDSVFNGSPVLNDDFVKGRVAALWAEILVNGQAISTNTVTGTFTAAAVNDTRSMPNFTDSQLRAGTSVEKDCVVSVDANNGVVMNLGPFIQNQMSSLRETWDDDNSLLYKDILLGKFVPAIRAQETLLSPLIDVDAVKKNIWISNRVKLDPLTFNGVFAMAPPCDITQEPTFNIYYSALDVTKGQAVATTLLVNHYFATDVNGKLVVVRVSSNHQRFETSSTSSYIPMRPGNVAIDTPPLFVQHSVSKRPENSMWIGTNIALLATNQTSGGEIYPLEELSEVGVRRIDIILKNVMQPGVLPALITRLNNLQDDVPITVNMNILMNANVAGNLSPFLKPTVLNSFGPHELQLVAVAKSVFTSSSAKKFKRIYTGSEFQGVMKHVHTLLEDPQRLLLEVKEDPLVLYGIGVSNL